MKVVFTQNLPGTAIKNDVKDVSNGYAYNFLFPRKCAVAATPAMLKKAEEAKANAVARVEELKENAQAIAKKLSDQKLVFKAKVSSGNTLYGAIGEKEIIDQILKDIKVELQKKNIKIKQPIKELGEHEVEIKITDDVSAKLKVVVEAEG